MRNSGFLQGEVCRFVLGTPTCSAGATSPPWLPPRLLQHLSHGNVFTGLPHGAALTRRAGLSFSPQEDAKRGEASLTARRTFSRARMGLLPSQGQGWGGRQRGMKGVIHLDDDKQTPQDAGDSLGWVSRHQVRALHSTLAPK